MPFPWLWISKSSLSFTFLCLILAQSINKPISRVFIHLFIYSSNCFEHLLYGFMISIPFISLRGLESQGKTACEQVIAATRGEERSVPCMLLWSCRGEGTWLCWGRGCRARKSEEAGRLYQRRHAREESWTKTCHSQSKEWAEVILVRRDCLCKGKKQRVTSEGIAG